MFHILLIRKGNSEIFVGLGEFQGDIMGFFWVVLKKFSIFWRQNKLSVVICRIRGKIPKSEVHAEIIAVAPSPSSFRADTEYLHTLRSLLAQIVRQRFSCCSRSSCSSCCSSFSTPCSSSSQYPGLRETVRENKIISIKHGQLIFPD